MAKFIKSMVHCFALFCIFFSTSQAESVKTNVHIKADPWYLSADGKWITHVYLTEKPSESVRLLASKGEVLKVPDWFTNEKTQITIRLSRLSQLLPITVTAESIAKKKILGKIVLTTPANQYSGLQFTVQAIGPYLINMAWFNLDQEQQVSKYRLYRKEGSKEETLIATLDAKQNIFHDDGVQPGHKYTYKLVAETNSGSIIVQKEVESSPPMQNSPISTMQGMGATLFFTAEPGSSIYYKKIVPSLLFQHIKQLNLKYIELRTVYGSFSHIITPEQIQWVDELLDTAHDNGIAVFSWCIPQRNTSSALAADIAMAAHKTAKGNTFAGIAVDLEIEKSYMNDVPNETAQVAIANFVKYVRKAVGKEYLFSAIIYSPLSMGVDNFPFKSIGENASIVQPMEFWHYHLASKKHVYTKDEVQTAIIKTLKQTREKVGNSNLPINIIGQITDLDDENLLTGVPTAEEITWALEAAKTNGALGLSFYNWNNDLFRKGQPSPQAQALKNFVW